MKIAWYTPYSNRSAIGLFSREVVSALLKLGHEITLIRSEASGSDAAQSSRDTICEIMMAESIDANVIDVLSHFDLVVYNVGNHLANHYYCLTHQDQVPGITILHDFILHNLLVEWLESNNSQSYLEVLQSEAGEVALEQYMACLADVARHWFMARCADFPVLRFAMSSTLGVVTHAAFYASMCERRLHCPVTTIPLAFSCTMEQKLVSPRFQELPWRLLTVGDVNLNKRSESIIRALSTSKELSSMWQYRIVGGVKKAYKEELLSLAKSGPYPVDVVILGKVEDSVLQQELHDAHAIACLRYPIIEGASASVIVSLVSGRPTLVNDGGCYGEIPDEYVYRVRCTHELEDVQLQLSSICSDYDRAIAKGEAARAWAIERHSGTHYAQALIPFFNKVLDARPGLKLADTISSHLSNWGCPPELSLIDRIDLEARKLFGDVF